MIRIEFGGDSVERYFSSLSDDERVPDVPFSEATLFGNRWDVGGFNALEAIQQQARARTSILHPVETLQWHRGLSLYLAGVHGTWDELPDGSSESIIAARCAQVDLLGLCLSSCKVALDTLRAGYISAAFGSIRSMYETILLCEDLFAWPEDGKIFYSEPTKASRDRMRVADVTTRLVNRHGGETNPDPKSPVPYFQSMYKAWRFTSTGSHPSGLGIGFTLASIGKPERQVGANYQPYATLQGFELGLTALNYLLWIISRLDRVDSTWVAQMEVWQDDTRRHLDSLTNHPAVIEMNRMKEQEGEE